ncbi:MAG: lytic transglycosylase domain-containing protein, partial [Acetobacteraceae bacterium]|nr:lytic transglycosylase domain-containing protein [Acetobacteraceae bacterium]
MSRLVLLLLLLIGAVAPRSVGAQSALCVAAIQAAEREAGIPAGLLLAIARVESGRRDAQTGRTEPWPWTINAEGRGMFFPSVDAAVEGVRREQAAGVRSIDTGCMQVNLRHHPQAFASLDEAFDPLTNARYAARFLTALRDRAGSWDTAVGHYHSQTPERAEPYRARVLAAWAQEQRSPSPPVALAAAPPAPPAVTAENGLRGLAAYRAAPIPLVTFAAVVPQAAPAAPQGAPASPVPMPAPRTA